MWGFCFWSLFCRALAWKNRARLEGGVLFTGISSAIVGARNGDQLKDNLFAGSWKLDEVSKEKLTEVSEPRKRYPKYMETPMVERRQNAVNMPSLPDRKSEYRMIKADGETARIRRIDAVSVTKAMSG